MISIATIAKHAHVSPATVTRVVNQSGYVSEEKRKAVMHAIEELGYIPNRMAGSLRRKKTNFIGYVLPELSENPFFTRFSNAFDLAAQQEGYQVLTMITHLDAEREKQLVTSLVGMMVEAIVFLGGMVSPDTVEWVLSCDIPVVMIERHHRISGVDAVVIDNYQAVRTALEHIVSRGHERIGFIGRDIENEIEMQRLRGFLDGMREQGLEVPKHRLCKMPDYDPEYGRQAICRMLDEGEPPTAVLVASDLLACGVLQELYKRELRVPDDISLVGFDNTLTELSSPPLTSVELQPDMIGAAAVDMVIERRQKERSSAKTVMFSSVLVDRESVRDIRPSVYKEGKEDRYEDRKCSMGLDSHSRGSPTGGFPA